LSILGARKKSYVKIKCLDNKNRERDIGFFLSKGWKVIAEMFLNSTCVNDQSTVSFGILTISSYNFHFLVYDKLISILLPLVSWNMSVVELFSWMVFSSLGLSH
jgi:hypothetical protein